MTDPFDRRKTEAAEWFRALRDRIVSAFEGLEDRMPRVLPAGSRSRRPAVPMAAEGS